MALALQESSFKQHYFVGTEHIFMGLCKSGNDLVLKALAQDRVDPRIRRVIREVLVSGPGSRREAQMVFTPRTQRLLKISQEIAQTRGDGQITPLHLLLGLLRAGEGVALRVLRRLEHNPEKLQEAAEGLLDQVDSLPSRGETPFLNSIGRDLTFLASQGRLEPVIGRDREISLMAQSLLRKKKNNLLLVGEAGVGKTSLVEALAQMIAQGVAPPTLSNKRIVEVSSGALMAGTKYRGDLELRIQRLLEESSTPDLILFIDEFHTIIGPTSSETSLDIANQLKPALAGGQLRLIGATTWKEYRRRIEPDAAFERRFQVIDVKELTRQDTMMVLQRLQETYEKHHQVRISPGALETAVDLTVRFLPDRRLPDKALDLLDQACANVRLQVLAGQRDQPAEDLSSTVGQEEVAMALAGWVGIPPERLLEQAQDPYLHLEDRLQDRILGQQEAIQEVTAALRLAHAGLTPAHRPRGVFFFIGPTGVGKTEMAKSLAEILLPGRQALVRLDMSEFMEAHAVAKLVGAPPGYAGYGEEGQLTGPVRRQSGTVVLFDEIDKAHPEVLNLLLQVLDNGKLTDARGRQVSFSESIIIFTANLAPAHKGPSIGFNPAAEKEDLRPLRDELSQRFRPEFLNRLDKIIGFHALSHQVCRQLVERTVDHLAQHLEARGSTLSIEEEVFDTVLEEADYRTYGAREIWRAVNRLLAEPLSQWLVKGKAQPARIRIFLNTGEIAFTSQDRGATDFSD